MIRLRSPMLAGAALSLVAVGVAIFIAPQGQSRTIAVGFWFEDDACVLPSHAADQLGGPLTEAERESIRRLSHAELERAFAGLRIAIGEKRDAFWRVGVRQNLPSNGPRPQNGEAIPKG